MKTQDIKKITTVFKRNVAGALALLLTISSASGIAYAAVGGSQVQYRSVKMSDNAISGTSITSGVGSGTAVTYRVTFQAASNYDVKGIILDFCSGVGGTPFIGDSNCPAPTGFSIPSTPTISTEDYVYGTGGSTTIAGLGSSSSWTASSTNSGRTLKMTSSTGHTLVKPSSPTNSNTTFYTFSVTGITNPNGDENAPDVTGPPLVKKYKPGTFYARLITYTSDTGDIDSYTASTPGNYQDYGGFALSTAEVVQVTAKVQETLSFCVSGTTDTTNVYPNVNLTPPDDCDTTQPPAIILGHGDNNTLDGSQIDRNTVWTLASTNALRGIAIRMHNSNACGGLSTDDGVTCPIQPIGPGTPTSIVPGVATFGMFCNDSETGPIGPTSNIVVVGAVTCDANYRDPAHTSYPADIYWGMDNSTTGDNVSSDYGDIVAASTEPVSNVRNRYDFAATASNTTPAGIYKANMAMIATGTF